MYIYHIYFKAEFPTHVSEHTRIIELEQPLEYVEDIDKVQKMAADLINARRAMLVQWTELKGYNREPQE